MKNTRRIFLPLIVFALLFLVGCNVDQTINDTIDGVTGLFDSGNTQNSMDRDIYEDAKSIMKNQIDTPASAVFPTFGSGDVRISSNEESKVCQVSSYLDCDNLMGAKVRVNYTLTIAYTDRLGGGAYTYQIDSIG